MSNLMEPHAFRQAEFAVSRLFDQDPGVERESTRICFGSAEINILAPHGDALCAFILNAFIPSLKIGQIDVPALAEIVIVRAEDSDFVPEMAKAVGQGFPIRQTPFHFKNVVLHADIATGVNVAWDRQSRRAIVHLRPLPELDPRALITPVRILLSWLADLVDGEIIHAAGLERSGEAVAVAGRSGSGKSTLARALCDRGWRPIADDALLLLGSRVFPVYRRAKWADWAGRRGETLGSGKPFVELQGLEGYSSEGVELAHVVYPRIGGPRAIRVLNPAEANDLISEACLPEVLGGVDGSRSRLNCMVRGTNNWRMHLDEDIAGNAEYLARTLKW